MAIRRLWDTPAHKKAQKATCKTIAAAMRRHKKDYTWAEIAEGVCISKEQLMNIAAGKSGTSLAVVFDLAAFFEVSPAVFFRGLQ